MITGLIEEIQKGVWGIVLYLKGTGKKKAPSNGVMSKKTRIRFQWPKLEQDEQHNKLSKSSFGIISQSIKQLFIKQFSEVYQDKHP